MTDNSLSIDDVCHAPRKTKSSRHTVALSDDATLIAQQKKAELVFLGKMPVGLHGVRTNADDLRSGSLKDLVPVPKGACLGCTDGSVILWIEVQHDGRLPEKISKADPRP